MMMMSSQLDADSAANSNGFDNFLDIFSTDMDFEQAYSMYNTLQQKSAIGTFEELNKVQILNSQYTTNLPTPPPHPQHQQQHYSSVSSDLPQDEFADSRQQILKGGHQYIQEQPKQQQQQQQQQQRRNMGTVPKHVLINKQSMPSLAKNHTNTIKKFKSTMDLTGDTLHELPQEHQHPQQQPQGFNFNNRVINKLDRIPSFYNKPKIPDPESRIQLLDKYAERKDKDKANAKVNERGNTKSIHTSDHHQNHRCHPHKKMGHVRYLNEGGTNSNGETYNIIPRSKSMVFNKAQNRWEGNEVDLLRFEHKPSLITLKEIEPAHKDTNYDALNNDEFDDDFPGKKRHGNMLYDNVNLKWINLDQDDEYIFDDIPDLIEPLETIRQHHNQQQQQQQQQRDQHSPTRPTLGGTNMIYVLQSPISRRGLSQFTQRTTSSTNTISTQQQHPSMTRSKSTLLRSQSSLSQQQQHQSANDNGAMIPLVSQKLIDKFAKEEAKINRKINHWFIDDNNDVKLDYYWEIRNLIMEN